MIASLLSAFTAFSLEVVLMGAGTVLGVDRSAARILGHIAQKGDAEESGGVD